MIKSVGIDLIELDRIKKEDKKHFLPQFLTARELKNWKDIKDGFYMVLFTIKEAILKACKIGLFFGSYWHTIEINRNYSLRLKQHLKNNKISIAHTCSKDYALSIALVED